MREDGTFVADVGGEMVEGSKFMSGGGAGGDGRLTVMTDLRRQLNAEREENRALREKILRVKETDTLLKVGGGKAVKGGYVESGSCWV